MALEEGDLLLNVGSASTQWIRDYPLRVSENGIYITIYSAVD